jgi:hypothetical protein
MLYPFELRAPHALQFHFTQSQVKSLPRAMGKDQALSGSCVLSLITRESGNGRATPELSASSKAVGRKGDTMHLPQPAGPRANYHFGEEERAEEARKIRRLQVMIGMVMSVISQDPNLTVEEASELAAGAKRAALAMFPDKELAFDLLYKPRLQRLMRERFHLQ